jgi:hypothetical protein
VDSRRIWDALRPFLNTKSRVGSLEGEESRRRREEVEEMVRERAFNYILHLYSLEVRLQAKVKN